MVKQSIQDIISKGQQQRHDKHVNAGKKIKDKWFNQGQISKMEELLITKESYTRDLKECANNKHIGHWIWINATIKSLEKEIKQLNQEIEELKDGITKDTYERLRINHESFYCPKGHSQNFNDKTKCEKKIEMLEKERSELINKVNKYQHKKKLKKEGLK